ncbi:MAG: glycosyltransferase [Myxococcales bacterium]|nr:glycosyltransferase [Myxococcales bacterium]
MMILPTYSPCRVEAGRLRIDRKFHVGTCLYAERLRTRIVVVAPRLREGDRQMDFVELPLEEVPYEVRPVACDGSFRLEPAEREALRPLVANADLLYGLGFDLQALARELGRPYVGVVEYNLPTCIQVATLPVSGRLRRLVRTLKTLVGFVHEVRDLRGARSVHCNGYPMYEQTRRFQSDCLLYLDSRMGEAMVIEAERLEARLASLVAGRRPRLLYSGRYEAMKGALDVVEVGLALAARGLDFELDLYGQGEQASGMRRRIETAGEGARVRVHEAIPYPELVERSAEADLFVCCHVQDDPSCTYLEASGAGLPIAGYGNRMWRHFATAAGSGVVTPMKRPVALAEAIGDLLAAPDRLATLSRRARAFALEHCFEREFEKRVDAIRPYLGPGPGTDPA